MTVFLRRVVGLMACLVVVLMIVATATGRRQSEYDLVAGTSPGTIAAAAIRKRLIGSDDKRAARFADMRSGTGVRIDLKQDPYLPWLAADLIDRASTGQLFSSANDTVCFRTTWEMGDASFWYFAEITSCENEGEQPRRHGPWVLWKYLGERVTPDGPEDRPQLATYPLPGVAWGDIVVLDLYRADRDVIDDVLRIDPASLIKSGKAQLVLRLPIPVSRESH